MNDPVSLPYQLILGFCGGLLGVFLLIFKYINNLNKSIGQLEGSIDIIKAQVSIRQDDIQALRDKYFQFKGFLDAVDQDDKQIANAKQLLEVLSGDKNKQAKEILTKLDEIKRSQPVIKIGRYQITHGRNTPQELMEGNGHREHLFKVEFGDKFRRIHDVFVAIAGIDADSNKNIRATVWVKPKSIENNKFQFYAATWDNSRLYGMDVIWIAIGEK